MPLTTSNLEQYVYNVLVSMEGSASNQFAPYAAGGQSGLAFGFMQNDVANQGVLPSTGQSAYSVLQSALANYGVSQSEITTIMNLASTKGVSESQFIPPSLFDDLFDPRIGAQGA